MGIAEPVLCSRSRTFLPRPVKMHWLRAVSHKFSVAEPKLFIKEITSAPDPGLK